MSTGWTWDYVEENLDLPMLSALSAYWADVPPIQVMIASYLGIKPKSAQKINDPGEIAALAAALRMVD